MRGTFLAVLAAVGCGDNLKPPASQDAPALPACRDGEDNDGDGASDHPADPGCLDPDGDDEQDACPAGATCPQCGNGIDDDGNGTADHPADPGCTAASDPVEYPSDPRACGEGLTILPLPATLVASGTLDASSTTSLPSDCGGTSGAPAVAYQLFLPTAKIAVVSTEDPATTANTLLDVRSTDCASTSSAIACNDDAPGTVDGASRVTASLAAGNHYIVVRAADAASAGAYVLRVRLYLDEGAACTADDQCGPGLSCRAPTGSSTRSCQSPACSNRVDDDGDGLIDFPFEPGCSRADDDSELDLCPGAECPECGDGIDNDGDASTDYPMDTTCHAASHISEACVTRDPVVSLTAPMTAGTTVGAADDVHPSCASTVLHTAGDRLYRLDLPATSVLDVQLVGLAPANWDSVGVLLDGTCRGPSLACTDATAMRVVDLPAGTYFYVVDGFSSAAGDYTISVSGTIANNASCESALFSTGALRCGNGYLCAGSPGQRVCRVAACADGQDDDGDGDIDFPVDPGCSTTSDDDETDPSTAPECADTVDNDTDGDADWPADTGCSAASGTSEVFCPAESDPTSVIATGVTTSTTVGAANDFTAHSCQADAGSGEVTFALRLPVPVETLVLDTSGSSFDTVLGLRDAQCGIEHGCDDDGGAGSQSKLTMSNVAAGNYAVVVDGWSGGSVPATGSVTLTIRGTVAPQTACSSPLFSGGTNAVLACPNGTTCTGSPARCQ